MTEKAKRYSLLLAMTTVWFATGCTLATTTDKGTPSDDDAYPNFDSDDGNEFPPDDGNEFPPDDGNEFPSDDTNSPDTGEDDFSFPSCFGPGFEEPVIEEGEGAGIGKTCKRTADCLEPLHCIKKVCEAPGPREGYCDGKTALCPNDKQQCVNFQCVNLNNRCWKTEDCPSGFECVCTGALCLKSECRAVDDDCVVDVDCAEDQVCDFGSCVAKNQCLTSSDLRGTFSATSTLDLSSADDGAVGNLLSATQWLRDLLEGGGLFPGVSDIISSLIRDFLLYNIQDYQIDLLLSLIDIPNILSKVQIEHQMTLESSCSELYRGQLTFEQLSLQYQGQFFTDRPENIPSIGALPAAEFGAALQCHTLAIDEFRVENLASGANRLASDLLTQVITQGRYKHLEVALMNIIDCSAVATYVSMAVPLLGWVVEPACRLAVNTMTKTVTKALIDKPSKMGWMKLQGEVEVIGDWQLDNGHFFGSTLTKEFTGEFSASK